MVLAAVLLVLGVLIRVVCWRAAPFTRAFRSNTKSYCNVGYTYTCPVDSYHSTACNNYLAGTRNFKIIDYEVFVISK